jgi:hypothetical protein
MVHEKKMVSFSLSMRSDVLWSMSVHNHAHKRWPETHLPRSQTYILRTYDPFSINHTFRPMSRSFKLPLTLGPSA